MQIKRNRDGISRIRPGTGRIAALARRQHQRRARFTGWRRCSADQDPTRNGAFSFRKYEITDSAVIRPVLGFSEGTFSIDIENMHRVGITGLP